ncbi:MAG: hypothetical protein ACKO5Q_09770, partial [Microcystaceae cyanobacterium]
MSKISKIVKKVDIKPLKLLYIKAGNSFACQKLTLPRAPDGLKFSLISLGKTLVIDQSSNRLTLDSSV